MQKCGSEVSSEENQPSDSEVDKNCWNEELISVFRQRFSKYEKDPEEVRLTRIKLCLKEGANINVQGEKGDTVLHVAIRKGYEKIIKFFCQEGARTDIPNDNGETAIKLAETLEKEDILSILRRPIEGRKDPKICRPSGASNISTADQQRPSTSRDSRAVTQRNSTTMEEDETYAAGATLTKSWPGIVYQLKHLAFTLHCALQQKDSCFLLATEMVAAEKLDDVVLLYKNGSGQQVGRFVQIKYKSNQSNMIFCKELLEPNGKFSLLTYFTYWRKIKKNFEKVDISHMILCTNGGVDPEEFKRGDIHYEKVEDPDKSFELKSGVKQTAWYKFSPNEKSNAKLYRELKATSDIHRLAALIAKCVYNGNLMKPDEGSFKDYHLALVREVFDIEEKKFQDQFRRNNEKLSDAVRRLREIFLSQYTEIAKPADPKSFRESIWEKIDERCPKLKFRGDFGKSSTSVTHSNSKNELRDDYVGDTEILNFLNEFTLAVNQPNGDELNRIIGEKISANNHFSLLNTQLLDCTLQTKLFDWFVTRGDIEGEIKYFSYKVGEESLKNMMDTVGSLITIGVNSMYCERIKAYNIHFTSDHERVKAFLTVDESNSISNRILRLVAPTGTFLTALRVYDTLQKIEKYEKMDSFIFASANDMNLPGIRNKVMTTFDSLHFPDLLIVECQSNDMERYLETLWISLSDIMARNVHKKIIVITQTNEDLWIQSEISLQMYYEENDEYSFYNLTDDSQTKLLKKSVTEFQGYKIESSFGGLLGINDPENLSEEEMTDLIKIIDSDILIKLISNDRMSIGNNLEEFGETVDYYINRRIYQRSVIENISANGDNNDRTSVKYLSEDELSAYDKPVIISDTAGMGKSTMLTYLARQIKEHNPNMLVLKVDLNHHVTALSKVMETPAACDLGIVAGAVQFLVEELLNYKTNFEKKVCEAIIRKRQNLALIFDGFDEISPTYGGVVIDLLKTLSDHGMKKLLIATRPHTKTNLEEKLNVSSYEIQQFSVKDQEEFLTKFWENKLSSYSDSSQKTEGRIKTYAKAIIEKLAESIQDQNNVFTGIPLQTRLVAEIFEDHGDEERADFDSCKKFLYSEVDRPNFPEKIDLIYLYKNFVDKKFDIYFFNKRGSNPANEMIREDKVLRYHVFIESHKRFALDVLFDQKQVQELLSSQQDMNHPLLQQTNEERTGIITQFINGRPHFGHRTYAEYFAAKFLSDLLQKGNMDGSLQKIFVADILLGKDYKNVRAFLNWQLTDEHKAEGTSWVFHLNKHRTSVNETIFHLAAEEGNSRITRLFLNCLNANPKDRKNLISVKDSALGRTALHRALGCHHLDVVKLLLEPTGFEIESKNKKGETPSHLAIENPTSHLSKYLVTEEAIVNSRDNYGWSPLHIASGFHTLEVVRYLLDKGANVNSHAKDGCTPLHMAVNLSCRPEIVAYLLDKGACVDSPDLLGRTPLYEAAFKGELEVVKYLVTKGAKVDSHAKNGCTPLHMAVKHYGELEVVTYLLDKGASVDSPDLLGRTPLYEAAFNGKPKVVKYLVTKGANVNSHAKNGCTPLHVASAFGTLEVVRYLLNKGANVNSHAKNGFTPLHMAVKYYGEWQVKMYLLDKGACADASDLLEQTPLYKESPSIIQLKILNHLTIQAADVSSHAKDGFTPLDKKANVDSPDPFRHPPLNIAAVRGRLETVKLLVTNGANVNSRDFFGKSPLDLASIPEVVEYLQDKGAKFDSPINHEQPTEPIRKSTSFTLYHLFCTLSLFLFLCAILSLFR